MHEILKRTTEANIMITVTHKQNIGIFQGFVALQLISVDTRDYKRELSEGNK